MSCVSFCCDWRISFEQRLVRIFFWLQPKLHLPYLRRMSRLLEAVRNGVRPIYTQPSWAESQKGVLFSGPGDGRRAAFSAMVWGTQWLTSDLIFPSLVISGVEVERHSDQGCCATAQLSNSHKESPRERFCGVVEAQRKAVLEGYVRCTVIKSYMLCNNITHTLWIYIYICNIYIYIYIYFQSFLLRIIYHAFLLPSDVTDHPPHFVFLSFSSSPGDQTECGGPGLGRPDFSPYFPFPHQFLTKILTWQQNTYLPSL